MTESSPGNCIVAHRLIKERKENGNNRTHTLRGRAGGILAGPNAQLQEWVDTGLVCRMAGHVGRAAQRGLQDGALVLPPHQVKDYYGERVPSYRDVEDGAGSPGAVANAEAYDPEGE